MIPRNSDLLESPTEMMMNKSYPVRMLSLSLSLVASVTWAIASSISPVTAQIFGDPNFYDDDYDECAADLLALDLDPEAIAAACASVLRPDDLSECVVDIDAETDIDPETALESCLRVRRPEELAECVVDINLKTQGGEPLAILDNCRRSLLPERFSECVVGLAVELGTETPVAMDRCIDGRDRPYDIYITPEPR